MSERPPLPLGPEMPAEGGATCGYGLTEPHCGAPATWHFYAPEYALVSCDAHKAYIESHESEITDRHAFGGLCRIPGANWYFSGLGVEGFCAFDLPDTAESLAAHLTREQADA